MAYPKMNSIHSEIDQTVQLKNNTGGPKEARVHISGMDSDVSLTTTTVNLTGTDSVYSNTSGDFSAVTNASAKTVTVTGLPYTITSEQLQNSSIIIDGTSVTMVGATVTGNVITLVVDSNFTGSEVVTLELSGPTKTYDIGTGSQLNSVINPEWKHYTSVEHIIDATDDTLDQHYSPEIFMEGYRNMAIQLTGSTGASGVVFTMWGTLNTAAATPADGDAAPSADWVDVSATYLGAATITLDSGASSLHFVDTQIMPYKLIIRYDCDHATNTTDIFIRRY